MCPECGSEEVRLDVCTGELDCVNCGEAVEVEDDNP